jgi:sensor histidine kinase YesM
MLSTLFKNLPSKYFVIGSIFFWMSVQAVYARIQFLAFSQTAEPKSWGEIWLQLSPWFCSWIFVTVAIFIATRSIEQTTKKQIRVMAYHLGVMLVLLSIYWSVSSYFHLILSGQSTSLILTSVKNQIVDTFHLDLLIYATAFFVIKGTFIYDEHMNQKLQFKHLQHALVEEQLKTLRTQLNPHFIFNALNTVVSLIKLKRENEAVKALTEISSMLRKILENNNNDDVAIKDEIRFINSYLAIQHMRFADKLDVSIEVDENCLAVQIPNMLLQPLVENAVQHGSQLESNMNPIRLHISKDEQFITAHLTNKVALRNDQKGFGIGMSATRERLARLYDEFKFEMQTLPDDSFETLLAIPLKGRKV